MQQNLYTIFDAVAESYSPPFLAKNKGTAGRMFADLVNGGDNDVSKHPQQFTLFELATWDDNKAIIEPHKTPISLGLAHEFKHEQQIAVPA